MTELPEDEDPDFQYEADDLAGYQTPFVRFVQRSKGWLAAIIVLALVLPAGGWAIDEFVFRRSGDQVEDALGAEAWVAESVVRVHAVDCVGRMSTGSGFVAGLGPEPVLVTNRHVVEDAVTVSVRPLDGSPGLAVAEHRVADGADVAVLELADADHLPAALPIGTPVRQGEAVRIVGFPGGRPTVTDGEVASADLGVLGLRMPVVPGASGSPVIDDEGLVVGQVFARSADGDGVATSIDALTSAARRAQIPDPPC